MLNKVKQNETEIPLINFTRSGIGGISDNFKLFLLRVITIYLHCLNHISIKYTRVNIPMI